MSNRTRAPSVHRPRADRLDQGEGTGRIRTALLTVAALAACSGSETTRPTPAVRFAASVLPSAVVGTPYDHGLSASGGDGSFDWTVTSGALPPGLTLSSAGRISGTPTVAGTSEFAVRVASADQSATANLRLTVADPLVVTTTALPVGRTGTAYEVTLVATGGVGSYTWSLTDGGLPPGLTLDATGTLSGTPVAEDRRDLTVRVVSGEQSATQVLSLAVFDPLAVATGELPEGIVGIAYSGALNAEGGAGPYRWSLVEGSLPAGLVMDTTGAVSGVPASAETVSFTVDVESGNERASRAFQLAVVDPLDIPTRELPTAAVAAAYEYALTATGGTGTYGWSVTTGSLPPGLELTETGVIGGTPEETGGFTFAVRAVSGSQAVTRSLELEVVDRLTITTTSLDPGLVGTPYSRTLQSAGGTEDPIWSLLSGSLPEGLELSGSGVVSGTPSAAGSTEFTVQATAGGQTATRQLALEVLEPLVIVTSSLPEAVVGAAYTAGLEATGGTGEVIWSLASGALPAGLALEASGEISGTPTGPGTTPFEIMARSGPQTATVELEVAVREPLRISTTSLSAGEAGTPYAETVVAAGGTGSYAFGLLSGELPAGTTLDRATGEISGTPTVARDFTFTIEVESGSQSTQATFTVTIVAPACSLDGVPDSDGDRLPDCAETNSGIFIGPLSTGTDPQVADTDGDGIEDGDEVLGTLDGLDLPAMGTNPLRKNILIEYDWFEDAEGGGFHDHRPSASSIAKVAAAFAAAPVDNPDGSTGIVAIQDYGQGGTFDGGTLVDDADGCLVEGVGGAEYAGYLADNFAANRLGYFHYSLVVHRHGATMAGSCSDAGSSSGQAFYNDHRSLVSSSTWHNGPSGDQWVANTILHEVGHNLNLSHGGARNEQAALNYKPNYPSVMNYRYQFSGIDTGCDVSANNFLDFSAGTRITLDESAVDEAMGVCGDVPIDWNQDGDASDVAISLDLQAYDNGPGVGSGNDSSTDVLEDYDDWANITLAGSIMDTPVPGGVSSFQEIESCTSTPPEPAAR